MEVINIALEQIANKSKQKQIFTEYDFFEEYFNTFNNSDKFLQNTKNSLDKIDKEEILNITETLKERVQYKLEYIIKDTDLNLFPGLITFIGDGSWDGHGIIVNDNSYVYFDLAAVKRDIENYNLDTYVTHELIHPIHYGSEITFYPGEYETVKDKYLKRLIAEGLATFLGDHYCDYNIRESYWLGLLEAKDVDKWVDNCRAEKDQIGKRLQEQIINNEFDRNLFYQLFAVTSSEYVRHRFGYYYGTQIVKNVFEEKTIAELINMHFNEYEEYIYKYFNLQNNVRHIT